MRRKSASFILILAAGLIAASAIGQAPPAAGSPNLLLIIVDTLRFDAGDVAARQAEPAVPPSLRRRGRHFLQTIATAPWTVPSITSLLTGYYPSESHVIAIGDEPKLKAPTLAQRLRSEGYRTVAVVSNPTLTRKGEALYEGFDTVDVDAKETRPGLEFPIRSAAKTTDATLARIAVLRRAPSPWFLLVHYFEPHGPYTAPAKFLRKPRHHGAALPEAQTNFAPRGTIPVYQFNPRWPGADDYIAAYQASARFAISQVERLLRQGARSGALGNAVVVFTSDHGEMLGEQNYWFQHGIAIDPALVHVPLVIARGARDPLVNEPRPVSNLDVFPTLCGLLIRKDCSDTRGEDLYNLSSRRRFPIVVEQGALAPGKDFESHAALAFEQGLLVGSADGGLQNLGWLSHEEPQFSDQQLATARDVIRNHLEFMRVVVRDPKTLDPELLKKLRALGYLQGPESDSIPPKQ